MPRKYSTVVRPKKGKKLKRAPGAATVGNPTAAEKELGLKKGDQVKITRSRQVALKDVSRAASVNEPGTIAGISRTVIEPIGSFANPPRKSYKARKLVK